MKKPFKIGDTIDLKPAIMEEIEENQRDREVGRYRVSEIYALLNNWTPPKEYLLREKIDFINAYQMWRGTGKHKDIEGLMKRLGYEVEVPIEKKVGEMTISGRCDFTSKDFIGDLKTGLELIGASKKWQDFQVKMYCSLFEKQYGYIVEAIEKTDYIPNKANRLTIKVVDCYLKVIGVVEKDDKWFDEQMVLLEKYHNKLKVVNKK